MRMTLYYLLHTVKNQIRKIFRTWVAIFILVCLVIGLVVGLGAALISNLVEDAAQEGEPTAETQEEISQSDRETQEIFDASGYFDENDPDYHENVNNLVELIASGVLLIVFVFAVLTADKSGNAIFLPADVNLLFQAPLRPQSVVLFRLIMQMGTSIVASLYLIFQIPNLVLNAGLSVGAALSILGGWFMMLIYSKLLTVFFYVFASSHPRVKKNLRYAVYTVLLVVGTAFFLYYKTGTHGNYFEAAISFFNADAALYVPVWGWTKGFLHCALRGQIGMALLWLGIMMLFAVLFALLIRRTKTDFYEDAMAKSEELAALLAQTQEKRGILKRKKDRKDKFSGGMLSKGSGANVYFYKEMYNRRRFAHFHLLTKTGETYLICALGICALQILVMKTAYFPAVAMSLAGFAFFRSLGNPIRSELGQDSFFLVPESSHKKVFFSFLAGITETALDLLPAILISAVLLRESVLSTVLWTLLILSISAFSDSMGLFMELSIPTSLDAKIRVMMQIVFIYFGLLPAAGILIFAYLLGHLAIGVIIAVAFHLLLTAISLLISPLFMDRGRK